MLIYMHNGQFKLNWYSSTAHGCDLSLCILSEVEFFRLVLSSTCFVIVLLGRNGNCYDFFHFYCNNSQANELIFIFYLVESFVWLDLHRFDDWNDPTKLYLFRNLLHYTYFNCSSMHDYFYHF